MQHNNRIDAQVGANIKKIRTLRGISRDKLATHLELTGQAVEKYEKGENRIAASTLVQVAFFLGCSVADILHGVDLVIDGGAGDAMLHKKTDQDMLKHYHDIESEEVQAAVRNLTRALAVELAAIFKGRKDNAKLPK